MNNVSSAAKRALFLPKEEGESDRPLPGAPRVKKAEPLNTGSSF